MKKIFLFSVICLAVLYCKAQVANPYEKFGYEGNVLQTQHEENQNQFFELVNVDTTALIHRVTLDGRKGLVTYFDSENEMICTDPLSSLQSARWISVDPVMKAGVSPYHGFANNPIYYIDPDGRDSAGYVNFSGSGLTAEKQKNFLQQMTNTFAKNGINMTFYSTDQTWDQVKDKLNPTDQFMDFGNVIYGGLRALGGTFKSSNWQHSTIDLGAFIESKSYDVTWSANHSTRGVANTGAHEVLHGLIARAVQDLSGGQYEETDFQTSDDQGHCNPSPAFPLNLLSTADFKEHSYLNDDWENDKNYPRALEGEMILPRMTVAINTWFVSQRIASQMLQPMGLHTPSQTVIPHTDLLSH